MKTILTNIYDSVHKLIEIMNFNERLPHNHNFCSTALNSPYISVLDKIQQLIKLINFLYLVNKSINI